MTALVCGLLRFCPRSRSALIVILVTLLFYSLLENNTSNSDQYYSSTRESRRIIRSLDDQHNIEGSCCPSCFPSRLQGPLAQDDPRLLQITRERFVVTNSSSPFFTFLVPPGRDPYHLNLGNISSWEYNSYRKSHLSWMFIDEVMKVLFDNEPPGFFVEAGAFDGEFNSNTLDLERLRGWEGLLVEADDDLFSRLKRKNRKAWTSNTCIATYPYPHHTTLVKFMNHMNANEESALSKRGFNTLIGSDDLQERMQHGFPVYQPVQCLPLTTLLLAMNVKHVNLISLDVEGGETDILKTFFSSNVSLTVDVWVVEHKHPKVKLGTDRVDPDFIGWFQSKGYTLYTFSSIYTPKDYVFIGNGSSIYDKAFSSRPSKFVKRF